MPLPNRQWKKPRKQRAKPDQGIASRIAFLREQYGMDILGEGRRPQLQRYTTGAKSPSAQVLVEIINKTGVDGHWLLTGEGLPHREVGPAVALVQGAVNRLLECAEGMGRGLRRNLQQVESTAEELSRIFPPPEE